MIRKLFAALLFACLTCTLLATASAQPAAAAYSQKPEILPSAASAPPADATGLTGQKLDWKVGAAPQWIWGEDQNKKYIVRKTFTAGGKAAVLRATCDNRLILWLNGKQIAEDNDWEAPVEVDIQKLLKPGENLLEAEIDNQGGPAAFVLKLILTGEDGKPTYVVSDDTWQIAESRTATAWGKPNIVAAYGSQPWGAALSADVGGGSSGEQFSLLPGFQIERLFTVPKAECGSWVCLTTDAQGRLIASDQDNKGLYRITPSPIGSDQPTQVERLSVKMTSAQGLLYADGSLYVSANGGPGSGLYRLRDTNGDDQYDEVVKLAEFRGGGEHGPHALRLSPDGKSIYVVCGNHTRPPFDVKLNAPPQTMGGARAEQLRAEIPAGMSSRIAPNWDEDLLLPRQWDGNGHAAGILAPGGWIARTDLNGKSWEIMSIGFRNQYDFALNADGEIFAYDADMEWDFGSPWYRPTRVVHATSGSEFGWRSGTGKWPTYYPDSLPPAVEIGPGSPVGVEFGYGTKFPAKYQKALFICDWTFGTMYAVHNTPAGASYQSVKEEFVSRNALPLTDVTVGRDGALYFTVGGRGTQSELFRVTYVGKESTAPADAHDKQDAELRELRRQVEAYHVAQTPDPAKAAAFLLPLLGHQDRHIRYAARVALERLPLTHWQDKVFASTEPKAIITGILGVARQGESSALVPALSTLDKLDFASLALSDQLELLRAYQLVLIRLGQPADPLRLQLGTKFDTLFPTANDLLNRELSILMIHLRSPQAANKLVPVLTRERVSTQKDVGDVLSRNRGYGGAYSSMLANQPDQQQYHYAFSLRNLTSGWTLEQRKTYFAWYNKARTWTGGASYQNFLKHMEEEAFANASDTDRLAVEAAGLRKPYVAPALPKAVGPGRDWTLEETITLASGKLKGRDFANGQRTFAAARCVVCHRFGGDGGATGPDLTQLAGRFNLKDLSEAIIDPSKVISDQYKATIIRTTAGTVVTGRVVGDNGKALTVVIDPESSAKVATINKDDIEEQKPSAVSLMPKDLLKQLNENEVLDLLAYLLSRGDPQNAMFRK